MATVTRKQCDNCKVEVELSDPRYATWWTLDRNVLDRFTEFPDHGHSDRFDFCSLPCVTAWTHSRELIRSAT